VEKIHGQRVHGQVSQRERQINDVLIFLTMPMIPPQHVDSPAALTFRTVCTRSAKACVEQMLG
jgi:hypothetical protein